MLQPVRAWLGRLIASAYSAQAQSRARLWIGRFVALAAIAAALGLGGYTIYRLDQRPSRKIACSQ